MKKQPQITEQTKRNIVEAFWSLYKKKDISKITVTETIKKAGYNRATFYNYFNDIQSILDYIEEQIINSVKQSIEKKSLITEFNYLFLNDMLRVYKIYGEYFSVLLSENGDPHFPTKFKQVVKPTFYNSLGKNLLDEFKIDIMYEFTASAILGAFSFWSKNTDKMETKEFFEFTDYLMNNGTKETLDKYSDKN